MSAPIDYYQEHQATYTTEARKLHKQMITLSMLRLLVFVATGFGIYFTFQNWQIALGIGVLGIAGFLFLLSIGCFVNALCSLTEGLIFK